MGRTSLTATTFAVAAGCETFATSVNFRSGCSNGDGDDRTVGVCWQHFIAAIIRIAESFCTQHALAQHGSTAAVNTRKAIASVAIRTLEVTEASNLCLTVGISTGRRQVTIVTCGAPLGRHMPPPLWQSEQVTPRKSPRSTGCWNWAAVFVSVTISWQIVQSLLIFLPSLLTCWSSWQRKQPELR